MATLHDKKRKPLIQAAPQASGFGQFNSFQNFMDAGLLSGEAEEFGKGGKARRQARRAKRQIKKLDRKRARLDKREARKIAKNPQDAAAIKAKFDDKERKAINRANSLIEHGRFKSGLRSGLDSALSFFGAGNVIDNSLYDTNTSQGLKSAFQGVGNIASNFIPGGQAIKLAAGVANKLTQGQQGFQLNPALAAHLGQGAGDQSQSVIPQGSQGQQGFDFTQFGFNPNRPQFQPQMGGQGGGGFGQGRFGIGGGQEAFNPQGLFGGFDGNVFGLGQGQPWAAAPMQQFGGQGGGFGGFGGFGGPQQGGGGFNFNDALGMLNTGLDIYSTFKGQKGGYFYEKGGKVKKYQQGGPVQQEQTPQLVDIQAEKNELIEHPTGFVTPVHARKMHSRMNGKNSELITDHPLEGSFIFSDFLKIKKSDAEEMVIGVKRHKYEEGKKGKEPITYTVGDLFPSKGRTKMTPAEMATKVTQVWKVRNNDKDMFDILADKLNLGNRKPYLDAIKALSEVERGKDDMLDQAKEIQGLIKAKKGGRMRSRRVYRPVPKLQGGGFPFDVFDPNAQQFPTGPMTNPRNIPPVPFLPGVGGGVQGGGFGNFPTPQNPLHNRGGFNFGPLDTMGLPGSVSSTDPNVGTGGFNPQAGINAAGQFAQNFFGGQGGQGGQGAGGSGNFMTQMVDQGSPFLRTAGTAAMATGAGINFGSNVAGAIGSFNLNQNFLNENRGFFQGQQDLVNQSRNIASQGNLFDVGLNMMKQGPEDLPINQASRLRQFDPFRQVQNQRQLAQQGQGQINSMFARNAGNGVGALRGLNMGNAISSNNQLIANAQNNALGQQFGIDQQIDAIDFGNQNILAQNRQRRTDFGNQQLEGSRQGFAGFFGNEASRGMDILGLNRAERMSDIGFRQNRLFQPLQFAGTAGQGLFDSGAAMFGFGTNFVPQQVPV